MGKSTRRAEEVPEEWRSLLPETQRALLAVSKRGGMALAEQVAQAIAMEITRLREQRVAERTELLVEAMEGGEEVGYPKVVTEGFEVVPGLEAWIAFTTEASLEELRQLVESIRLRKRSLAGRQRLAKL